MLLILVLLVFWCTGCGNSAPTNESPYIFILMYPDLTGEYQASAIVLNENTHQFLNDAVVTVNGIKVANVNTGNSPLPGISPGMTVAVHISHSQIGTFDQTFTIPGNITTLAISQPTNVTNWLNNSDTLTLSWTENGSTGYTVNGIAYDANNFSIPSNNIVISSSHSPATIDAAHKAQLLSNSSGDSVVKVQFYVSGTTTVPITGGNQDSKIEAYGSIGNIIAIP